MLSFAEEIYLLALDEDTGKIIIPNKDIVLGSALVGAVFSELSFLNKLDTDVENLYILNTEPTGRPVLDFVLEILAKSDIDKLSIEDCLGQLLMDVCEIENLVLKQLLNKNILKKEEDRILWIFPSHRYPIIDSVEIKDVETRLCELVKGDDIPDPKETVLVSLVQACGLFGEILSPREYKRCEERIKNLAKMDLVGQKVQQLIIHINNSLSTIVYKVF